MCYERKSYFSEDRKAEANRAAELKNKRTEVIDTLLRDADKARETASPEPKPVKESAPAK